MSLTASGQAWDSWSAMAMALDTLAYARRLREAGFSEQQAEGQAEALAAAMTDTLATKQDLALLGLDLEKRFSGVDVRFAGIEARFSQIDERFSRMDERFSRIDARFEHLERHMDTRLVEQERRYALRLEEFEKRTDSRFAQQDSRLDAKLADLERRMTMRLGGITVAGIGIVSALVRIL